MVCTDALRAQQTSSDYYPYDPYRESETEIRSDEELFFIRPENSRYGGYAYLASDFGFVRLHRRGFDRTASLYRLDGIHLGSRLSPYPDYRLLSIVERICTSAVPLDGLRMPADGIGGLAGVRELSASSAEALSRRNVTLSATDARSRWGARVTLSGKMGRKWSYAAALERQWGRDAHVKGVFTDRSAAALLLTRSFDSLSTLSLLVAAAPQSQGLRMASTQEAFDLYGSNLYNPAWGYDAGKVRNSRVRRDLLPLALLSARTALGRSTRLSLATAVQAGRHSLSALNWYDASSPLPDYYRSLPGFTGDDGTLASLWREHGTVTRIDWDDLRRQNAMGSGSAVYMAEERVEEQLNLQAAALFTTRTGERTRINYGLRGRSDRSTFYKRAKDMLGADYLLDIDQYLTDDERYGDKYQNDRYTVGRQVRRGERFGYRYDILRRELAAEAGFRYRDRRMTAEAGGRIGAVSLRREGHYWKESYAESASAGRSRDHSFTEYLFKFSAGYALSMRHRLTLSAAAEGRAPQYDDLFYTPDYSNDAPDRAGVTRTLGAEAGYAFSGIRMTAGVSAYLFATTGGRRILRYYDDLSSTYSDLLLTGEKSLRYGIEAYLSADVSPSVSLDGTLGAGHGEWRSDPRADILSDIDHTPTVTDSRSYMTGVRLPFMPSCSATGRVSWLGRSWRLALSARYVAGRYTDPDPARRMTRVANLASSPEQFAQFVSQERLPDAFTLDATCSKWFYIGSRRLSLFLAVNNLLDRRDIVYSAYEQMRVRKRGSGVNRTYAMPESKYLYAYPRTYYVSLGYTF